MCTPEKGYDFEHQVGEPLRACSDVDLLANGVRADKVYLNLQLAQSLGQPTLIVLAATILARRASYYNALEAASKQNEITDWLAWSAGVTIEAQRRTLALVEFLIEKAKLFDRLKGQLNDRQQKALLRMFKEGPEGFKGGLSAGKYGTITGSSPATATRDLVDLTEKGALVRTGELRHARYNLSVPLKPVPHVTIGKNGELVVG
jgi:Fic family protein